MINKNSFVKIMDTLRDYNDGLSALEKSLDVMFESNWMINVFDGILDALFEDIEEDTCPEDVDPILYQFAFCCDWGRKENAYVEIDGKRYSFGCTEDLYDLLVKLKEERNNE